MHQAVISLIAFNEFPTPTELSIASSSYGREDISQSEQICICHIPSALYAIFREHELERKYYLLLDVPIS